MSYYLSPLSPHPLSPLSLVELPSSTPSGEALLSSPSVGVATPSFFTSSRDGVSVVVDVVVFGHCLSSVVVAVVLVSIPSFSHTSFSFFFFPFTDFVVFDEPEVIGN